MPDATQPSGPVEQVSAWVADGIRDGTLASGQRLVELDIARSLGVGRNAVREAVQRLAADGLVTLERHRGPAVRRLSRRDVQELYELREVLEGLAARQAASCEAGASELGQLIAELDDASGRGDADRYARLNTRFHELIVAMSGRRQLAELLGRLSLPACRLQFRSLLDPAHMRESQADHRRIGALIAQRDASGAEAAMRAHVARAAAALQTLPDRLFAPPPLEGGGRGEGSGRVSHSAHKD